MPVHVNISRSISNTGIRSISDFPLIDAHSVWDFVNDQYYIMPNEVDDNYSVSRAGTKRFSNSNNVVSSFSDNVLSRNSDKGANIELARTNLVTNSALAGAVLGVIGSGGVAPTGISIPNPTGTREIVFIGNINGIEVVDVRFTGIPLSTGAQSLGLGSLTGTIGQTYTNSVYLALIAGNLTNTSTFTFRAGGEAGGLAFTPNSTLSRYTNTRVLTSTTSSGVVRWNHNDTVTSIDFTIRFGLPQTELAPFVSTPIRTSGGTVTRPKDVVSFSSNITDTMSWVVEFEGVTTDTSDLRYVLSVNDGSVQNRFELLYNNSNQFVLVFNSLNGTASVITLSNIINDGLRHKVAVRYNKSTGAYSYCIDGGTVFSGTSSVIPGGSTISNSYFGSSYNTTQQLCGNLRMVANRTDDSSDALIQKWSKLI